jgi:leader peptidase (prepilin peptidase)/N-methyltransferase
MPQFIFILFTGLCLGSFASLLAYRLPRGLPWGAVRSQCPACGHVLGAADLIPLVSWIILRGRCRYCQSPVSIRYLLLEIAGAGTAAGFYLLIGWHWALIPALALTPFVMAFALMRLWPSMHDQAPR